MLWIVFRLLLTVNSLDAEVMAKEVQMSIKMEPDLRDRFMAVAAAKRRPAAQIVRELMHAYIDHQEEPNQETIAAIEAVQRGEANTYESADALFRALDI
jgi:predicted DNA-binding protein